MRSKESKEIPEKKEESKGSKEIPDFKLLRMLLSRMLQ